jgi:hypothetical protein
MHDDPDWSPPVANTGAVDVSPAGPGGQGAAGVSRAHWQRGFKSEIAHGEWEAWSDLEDDSDGFSTIEWFAKHRETGEERILHHSRFGFQMTEARFRYLVENDFPLPPGKGPWTGPEVDAAMEDGA